jgi:hypothetical protein
MAKIPGRIPTFPETSRAFPVRFPDGYPPG